MGLSKCERIRTGGGEGGTLQGESLPIIFLIEHPVHNLVTIITSFFRFIEISVLLKIHVLKN